MTYSRHSASASIFLALSILPALVNGYDCNSISSSDSCSDESSLIGYSQCMLKRYSISAFIQCASQSDAADFSATTNDDGGIEHISATDVLTNGLDPSGRPLAGCADVPLAGNIVKTANNHGSVNFARYLCDQYHPLNWGLCRLRNCLLPSPAEPEERSLQAFCSDTKLDLMNEVLLPSSCGAGDPTDFDSSSSSSPSAAYSSDSSSPTDEAAIDSSSSSSGDPTQSSSSPSSTAPTTSPVGTSAIPTSGTTSTSPTPQATPATGASASRSRVSYRDLGSWLGSVMFSILVF